MGLMDGLVQSLASQLAGQLSEEAKTRVAGLMAARSTMVASDVYDHIRLARFILTGHEDEPEREMIEVRTVGGGTIQYPAQPTYPYESGDVLVLGPEIFSSTTGGPAENTVISWQGENFVPQRDPEPLTGVVGPDPEFGPVPEQTDSVAETTQTVEDVADGSEPAPSAGANWVGRRG